MYIDAVHVCVCTCKPHCCATVAIADVYRMSGLLVGQLEQCSFYEQKGEDYKPHLLPTDGNFAKPSDFDLKSLWNFSVANIEKVHYSC